MQVIVFLDATGTVCLSYPTEEALQRFSVNQIALAAVPQGRPFKIVDISELPLDGTVNEMGVPNIDRSFRDSWTVDEADLTDGVGAEWNALEEVTA